MNYEVFRSAVCEFFHEVEKEWSVAYDWGDPPVDPVTGDAAGEDALMEMELDFIELEREEGAFYEFVSIPVRKLFHYYQEEGWDATVKKLEKHVYPGKNSGRNRGIDYPARLNEEGKKLYEKLRSLRADIAARKQMPAYIVFTNRTLYEFCCCQPQTMEELREVYGVGDKNSREYGREFLDVIVKFTGGRKRPLKKWTGESSRDDADDIMIHAMRPGFTGPSAFSAIG